MHWTSFLGCECKGDQSLRDTKLSFHAAHADEGKKLIRKCAKVGDPPSVSQSVFGSMLKIWREIHNCHTPPDLVMLPKVDHEAKI